MESQKQNLLNQSGQAAIEYILMLFVVLALFFGVVMTFSDGTRRFMHNYFGAYFQCLLEAGELPTLGGDPDGDLECESAFQPFTFSDGRSPIGGAGFDTSSADSSSQGAERGSGEGGGDGGDSDSSGSRGAETGGDGGLRVTMGSGMKRPNTTRIPIVVASKSQDKDKDADKKGPTGFYNNVQSDDFGGGESRPRYIPILGSRFLDDEGREGAPGTVALTGASQEGQDLRDKKRVPAQEVIEKSEAEDVDAGLSLPDYLRYLLIIGIVLAIVVFFGGQVLNYQNSD